MWKKQKNLLVFPHHWQRPARTEEWAYWECLANLGYSQFVEIVCFPWASFIDAKRKGQVVKVEMFGTALLAAPPKKTLVRATVCQHIYAKDMLSWFKKLEITDLYWSHAVLNEGIIDGIRVYPFQLYPVQSIDKGGSPGTTKPIQDRKYLYSFIGAYEKNLYLTEVRNWIFRLPSRPDAIIVRRSQWHYETEVYQEQVKGIKRSKADKRSANNNEAEYINTLKDSVFSLCPSGSGPNSIRLWESLGLGCIPVILSDNLRLPGKESEWNQAVVFVKESPEAVKDIPQLLENLYQDKQKVLGMQKACRELWEKYGVNGPISILNELTDTQVIRHRIE